MRNFKFMFENNPYDFYFFLRAFEAKFVMAMFNRNQCRRFIYPIYEQIMSDIDE